MSHLLDVQQSRQPGTRYVDRWLTARWARILVQAGVVLFLVTATGLLVYETYGLDPLNRAWPITSYVRCATHLNGALGFVLSAFGGGFFCFIVGHWLWYPSQRESE